MPTYEYHCEKCGGRFDFRQSMNDPRLTECPESACVQPEWGHGRVERQLGTGAGLIFKGSGFYITDYRSENYKAGAKQDAPSSAGGSKEGGGASAPAPSSGGTPSGSAPASSAPAPSAPSAPAGGKKDG